MPTNRYNRRVADTEPVSAGTLLYRIMRADATWDANSFNMKTRPCPDPDQGRFEPTDPKLGGYIYVADTVEGAVAEGVLRNKRIPESGLVQRAWLTNKKIALLRLDDDVTVASVYGSGATKLNLDASLLCCGNRGYTRTRTTGTQILLKTAAAYGMRYPCRNHDRLTSLMLITRAGPPPGLVIEDEMDIFYDSRGSKLVFDALYNEWGLLYTGAVPP
ncbi:RES domain-containing protein [Mycobacterium sp.]|uniref:RES domain-containing protein n=1 Tax=Mycobacterium sp. TaxID=1785 RepID=UPI003F9BAAC2